MKTQSSPCQNTSSHLVMYSKTNFAIWLLAMLLLPPIMVHAQFTYNANADGVTATITGYIGSDGTATIPSMTNGLLVTRIGDYAFVESAIITSLEIPQSVTNVGTRAIAACSSLTNIFVNPANSHFSSMAGVLFDKSTNTLIQFPGGKAGSYTIPETVTLIGDAAFAGCFGLTAVAVSATNKTFRSADGVLFNTNQTTLILCPAGKAGGFVITNSVTNIADQAFAGCSSLTNITIGTNVTSIGNEAFFHCTGLTDIRIPGGVTNIGGLSFGFCTGLTCVTLTSGVTGIGELSFYHCTSLTNVTIPNTVTILGPGAFAYCISLTSVPIPNSVTNIGFNGFYFCTSLTNVTIPASVISVGIDAFYGCSSLTAITVATVNSAYSSMDGVLFNKSTSTLILFPGGKAGSYPVPVVVANIGVRAFAGCTNLTSIAIGTNVTSIGDEAFLNCTGLTNVTVPNSVTIIGNGVFGQCTGLTSVSLPNNATFIGDGAFGKCTALATLTIPKSVTSVGSWAFGGCTGLTGVYFQGDCPSLGLGAFDGDNNATVYYLPGTMGWNQWISPPLAFLWNPVAQTSGSSFGVRTNRFGFNITGTTNIPIVVETCTNLASPVWVSLQSGTLTNGLIYFSDSQWTNYPRRFYRIRSP